MISRPETRSCPVLPSHECPEHSMHAPLPPPPTIPPTSPPLTQPQSQETRVSHVQDCQNEAARVPVGNVI